MLVLSRQRDETVVIKAGDQTILVNIVDVRGDKIRLGFTADPAVTIDRLEVWERKEVQRKEAEAQGRA